MNYTKKLFKKYNLDLFDYGATYQKYLDQFNDTVLFAYTCETADSNDVYIVTNDYDAYKSPGIMDDVYCNDYAAQEQFNSLLEDIIDSRQRMIDTGISPELGLIYADDFQDWIEEFAEEHFEDAE